MSSLPTDLENSLGYQYEDPKAFKPYYLLLVGLDFVFNWIIDWAHTDPLAVLVIFVFQCLGLIVNLIVYVMASGSQAMQTGLRKSLIYHHQVHLITSLLYISITCSWYIWALRKSWPSVSDQFSFSFGPEIVPTIATPNPATFTTTTLSTTTTLLPPLIFTNNMTNGTEAMVTSNLPKSVRTFTYISNLFSSRNSRKVGNNDVPSDGGSSREFYTLWSTGFVALYTIQRTVAILYYFMSLKAAFLVLNASTIDSFEDKNGGKMRITKSPGTSIQVSFGLDGRGRRISADKTQSELEQSELDLEKRIKRLRNFVNNNPPDSNISAKQGASQLKLSSTISDIVETNKKKRNG